MRYHFRALGSLLAGGALVALTSCNTDDPQTEAGLAPTMSPSVMAVSAHDIVKVGSMTIDGNLSDWTNISAIPLADDPANGRGAANNSATVKLAWNDTYLYAAYNVSDSELLTAQTARDGQGLYQDDGIELYVDPQGDGGSATNMTPTDYHFLTNVSEVLGDSRGTTTGGGQDVSYNAASFVAQVVPTGTVNVSGTDTGYTIELRVAWTDLGVTPAAGNFMRIDPAVGDRDTPVSDQFFDWANLGNDFNNPSGWKDVQLVNPPQPVSAYDIVKVGSMTVDGNLGDWAAIGAISMADNSGRTGGLDNTAKVKLAWNDTYLYAAYDVTDTDLRAIQTIRDADSLWRDDEVELYVDPQGDGWPASKMTATDYHFQSSVTEILGDSKGTGANSQDASYNPSSYLAQAVANGSLNATGTDVGYTVELRVAWSDLGVTPAAGKFMRIDAAVGDRDGNPPPSVEYFDWANLASFNNPGAWKDVQLVAGGPPPPPAPGGTIGTAPRNGRLWDISGNSHRTSLYQGNAPEGPGARQFTDGMRIEAGTGSSRTTWTNTGSDPAQSAFTITRIGDGNDLSWHGGYVLGNSREDGSVNWDSDTVRDYHDQMAFAWSTGLRGLIEHFSGYNKGDGVGMGYGDVSRGSSTEMNARDGMVIRYSALEGMGDDAVENDLKDSINVYQNYLSGVVILSARPAKADISQTTDTHNKVMVFDGNLCWLRPKRFADSRPRRLDGTQLNQGDPGVFRFWKWQIVNPQYAMKIALRNNILRYDETAQHDIPGKAEWTGDIWGSLEPSNIVSPSNNVVLFPNRSAGQGLPPQWPTGLTGFTYVYGNEAKARWNDELNAWMAAHPEVKVTDPGLFAGF